ncbi:flagellar protein MotY [Oceanimonas baumannii]|uniref:Flagellar protein MotY n=1 Tax=Oceanimonas baumannii TaxID=129578 RepID=A0A235CHH0_9GAMM|nr:OmpA family protein [Oceanimonas baumannii]MCC4265762.1 OmpA family protein [Oceanimonas baumannii]OYD23980.1 flagellar protein MotY [Oceanimonas baumannii]TDW58686.1 OmpA family protein [Oceanimonas baumannii]
MRKLTVVTALMLSSASWAQPRSYVADLEHSRWRLAADSAVECRLEHNIPGFGTGAFVSRAGKNVNLVFELSPLRAVPRTRQAALRSESPYWQPGQPARPISKVTFYQQFNVMVEQQNAWVMLDELSRGRWPTFYFEDWYAGDRTTGVGLSSVNFRARYAAFLDCQQSLLPYGYEDIAFSVLNYVNNADELTPHSRRRLAMIADYIKADPNIGEVVINTYTDSFGTAFHNKQLSLLRAKAIKDQFMELGLPETSIMVEGHGERRPVADNSTAEGRSTNRRVVISLGRTPI